MKFTNSRFLKQSKTPTITSTPSLNSRCSYASITCKYRRNLVFICSAKTGTASTPSAQSARHLPNLIRNHRHQKHKRLAKPRVRKNRPRPRRRERNISDSCLLVQVSKQIPTNLLRLAYRFRSQYTPVAAVTCNLLLLVLDLAVDRVKPHKPVILGKISTSSASYLRNDSSNYSRSHTTRPMSASCAPVLAQPPSQAHQAYCQPPLRS